MDLTVFLKMTLFFMFFSMPPKKWLTLNGNMKIKNTIWTGSTTKFLQTNAKKNVSEVWRERGVVGFRKLSQTPSIWFCHVGASIFIFRSLHFYSWRTGFYIFGSSTNNPTNNHTSCMTSLKLTACPWKWMVGRWNFLLGRPFLSGDIT